MRESEIEFLYIKDFLPQEEFHKVTRLCRGYEPKMKDDELEIVDNRKRYRLTKNNYVTNVFSSKHTRDKLKLLQANPSDTPIEYRVYGKGGRMGWHCDDKLYLKRQYEIVYTTENTSDSRTEWIDPITKKLYSLSTEPNSALIVRAQTVLHHVTPITQGERKILKFAYV
tara:strand:+ start:2643 stop:3149 length:507 start_codon:yes stop_codon:yes gene_type:complete